jgi:cytochrome c5
MSEHHSDHGGFIKTPKQLIVVVILSFAVPIATFVLLSQLVTSWSSISPESPMMSNAAISERIKPVAEMGEIADPNAPKAEKSGEEIVKTACSSCHATGALNAPKIGDADAWKPRIAAGLDKLVSNATNGLRQMPARGGNPAYSNNEIARAVVFMANKSGASFKETKK